MQQRVEDKLQSSNSYQILKDILARIAERSFHHHTHILYDLRDLFDGDVTYMEIGSYCGASASLLLQHPRKTHVYCIDPLSLDKSHFRGHQNQEQTLRQNLEKFKGTNTYTVVKGLSNSKTVLNTITGVKVDILFIDGDHTYKGVKQDFSNYEHLVRAGGFIVFDDYLDSKYSPDVKKAVDDIVKELDLEQYEVIGSLPNYSQAYPKLQANRSNEYILFKKSS